MKKILTTVGVILGLVTAVVALWFKFKKDLKNLEEREKKIKENTKSKLNEFGVSLEKVEDEFVPGTDDDNLVKSIFVSMEFSSEIDTELIDVEAQESAGEWKYGWIDTPRRNVIHVRQSSDTKRNDQQRLDFLLEIPEVKVGNFRSPRYADYIRCCKSAAEIMWQKYLPYSRKPFYSLVAYGTLEYRFTDMKEDDQAINLSFKIPESWYKDFADEKHDGLTAFIDYVNEHGYESINLETLDFNIPDNKELEDVMLSNIQLFFQISFDIKSEKAIGGIDLVTSLKCLQYLIDDFKVSRDNANDRDAVWYEHIAFHAPDYYSENQEFSLLWYYTTDDPIMRGKNRKVIVDSYIEGKLDYRRKK